MALYQWTDKKKKASLKEQALPLAVECLCPTLVHPVCFPVPALDVGLLPVPPKDDGSHSLAWLSSPFGGDRDCTPCCWL